MIIKKIEPKTIEVTQDDIDYGVSCQSGQCPVALAIKRAYNTNWVSVGLDKAMFKNGEELHLPYQVQIFIQKFDFFGRKRVLPFIFDLK